MERCWKSSIHHRPASAGNRLNPWSVRPQLLHFTTGRWITTSSRRCSVHASSPTNASLRARGEYFGLGVRGDLEGFRANLSERFIKDRSILSAHSLHEIRILKRVITYHSVKPVCPEMTYEADPRHGETSDKAAVLARHPLAGPLLDEKHRVAFRSVCMRCLYLALDPPDFQFTVEEISRAMASPTIHADETLKALPRYMAGYPRVL